MEDDNSTIAVIDASGSIYIIMFILLLIVEIPSILCTIFILIFFLFNWHLLMIKVLHNHVVFLLMIMSFLYITLDLPFTISYYHLGYDRFRTRSFCLWWYWLDYTVVLTSLLLTATASIQRHILVFNSHWLHESRRRCILHYIPLVFCILYPSLYYLIFIVFYPCETLFDETYLACPFPCYSNDSVLFYVDCILNVIFPVFVLVTANVALICRAVYSFNKFRHPQSRTWKKRRKLTLQLFAFSSLYVAGWTPSTVVSIMGTVFLPNLYSDKPNLYYINNSSYFICPLQPFICFFALPELLKFIQRKIRKRTVVTTITATVLGNTHI